MNVATTGKRTERETDVSEFVKVLRREVRPVDTRNVVEKCWGEGKYWALNTGNSLADYIPLENYLVVVDEALKMT